MSSVTAPVRKGQRRGSLLEYIVMGVTVAIVLLLSLSVQGFATSNAGCSEPAVVGLSLVTVAAHERAYET